MAHETGPDNQELLPKARKDPFDPFVQVTALTDDEYATRRRKTSRPWKPITLGLPFLLAIVLVSVGLIVLVVWLLRTSNAKQGLLFAPDVNDLPLRRAFLYLYLPTIVSVIYSFLWTWIDLDVKRLEPFFQLSRPGGVTAENSILLHYPFDFLAMVPFKALRRKHWSVFASSMVMVLIFWGLTPMQSGLFAVRTILVTEDFPTKLSDYTPIERQGNLSALYAQSVYNIAWLDESMPSFMTTDFMLQPFAPFTNASVEGNNVTYSGGTTMYSLDLICEPPTSINNTGAVIYYESEGGCVFEGPPYRPMGGNDTSKPYDAFYAGHMGSDGSQNWYLEDSCQETFFARWSKSNEADIQSSSLQTLGDVRQANATALFCSIYYHQQDVEAMVALPDQNVLQVVPWGSKQSLPIHLINTTGFERYSMNERQDPLLRLDYPTTAWPSQTTELIDLPLNLEYMPQMAAFAIGTYSRPIADYLDPISMRMSYQAAFRLLFARRLSDIFDREMTLRELVATTRSYNTQAVVVVPGFAYAVLALLALIVCLTVAMLCHIYSRPNYLRKDPSTIAALMRMSHADPLLVATFANFGTLTMEKLDAQLRGSKLAIEPVVGDNTQGHKLVLKHSALGRGDESRSVRSTTSAAGSATWTGVRPTELRSLIGLAFIMLQVLALVSFSVLYAKANNVNGLPLPSNSMLIRQLLENYIPVAAATMMEPFWLVLNRLICMLQPWEEMRRGNAQSLRSLQLNYHSLPPQFVVWRALSARHLQLAFVCWMSILANGLTVALGGLMYEGTVQVSKSTELTAKYSPTLRMLNGTGAPFNAPNVPFGWRRGTINDEFYRTMSNQTAHTPLPKWTDGINAYLPVDIASANSSLSYSVSTQAIGTDLQCQALSEIGASSYNLTWSDNGHAIDLSVNVPLPDASSVVCDGIKDNFIQTRNTQLSMWTNAGLNAMEIGVQLTSENGTEADIFCRQHVLAGWIRAEFIVDQPPREDSVWQGNAMTMNNVSSSIMLCKPTILRGNANVEVDSKGQVKRLIDSNLQKDDSPAASALVAQANRFLVDIGGTWHEDSFPSDFTSYLIEQRTGNNGFLDSEKTVPEVSAMAPPFVKLYSSMFATLVGTNLHYIFENATATTAKARGDILSPRTRIFVSVPAFVVSITILSLYIITSIWIYARRPWRILPRLPTTIASIIAYFAPSNALREMSIARADACETWREWKWGYGVFVGTDGKAHVGIEREPLLMLVGKHGIGGTFDGASTSSMSSSRDGRMAR